MVSGLHGLAAFVALSIADHDDVAKPSRGEISYHDFRKKTVSTTDKRLGDARVGLRCGVIIWSAL